MYGLQTFPPADRGHWRFVALWKNTRSPSTTEVGTDVIDVRFVEECQMGCPNVGPTEGFIEVSDALSLVAIGCGDKAELRV